MTAVYQIADGYFARAKFYNWRARVDRRNGRTDEAADNELLGWDYERIACRIRAQVRAEQPWPQPGLDDYLRRRQADLQRSLAS